MPNWSSDDIARIIIKVGQQMAITPRGIVIGLATGLVESDLTVYANAKVPGSLNLPHDAVGSDGMSVGVQQQQVIDSGNGWWWGPVEECQDPTSSTRLFFSRLKNLDYNNPANSPGSYAQAVQGSAYPDRYDQRMSDAQTLYDQIAGAPVTQPVGPPPFTETDLTQNNNNCESRDGYAPRLIILHTEEGGMTGSAFVEWMANNGVSYGYTINPDGSVDDMETDDVASWSVLDPANEFSINICFAGSSASWSRQQWLNIEPAIKSAAYLAVRKCLAFNIPIQILVGSDYPKVKTQGGITDHNAITVTQLSPGSTHTDVGPNFPWDVLQGYLTQYTPGAPVPTPTPVDPLVAFNNWVTNATDRELIEYVVKQLGPGDPSWQSKNKTLRDKVFGV